MLFRRLPAHEIHHNAGSILPFLYATPTILTPVRAVHYNRKIEDAAHTTSDQVDRRSHTERARRPSSHRHSLPSSPRNTQFRQDFVPFEGLKRKSGAIGAEDDFTKGTTVTRAEKKAFQELFRLSEKLSRETSEDGKPKSVNFTASKGSVARNTETLGDALLHAQESVDAQHTVTQQVMTQSDVSRPDIQVTDFKDESLNNQQRAKTKADLSFVQDKFNAAKSDQELWQALLRHVLSRVAALRLDPVKNPRQADALKQCLALRPKVRHAPVKAEEELELLTSTLPRHLTMFMSVMRAHFPASPLSLAVLPLLKKLGPSAFALGASTRLYNAHMTVHYQRYNDLPTIATTLEEMDRHVYAFDMGTEKVLDRIAEDAATAMSTIDMDSDSEQVASPALSALWQTERSRVWLRQLWRWRKTIEARRQRDALRKAQDRETLDRVRRENEMADTLYS